MSAADDSAGRDRLPHAIDGLTRAQRIVLHELREAARERTGRPVPTVMLYGRVIERIDLSEAEFLAVLRSLMAYRPE